MYILRRHDSAQRVVPHTVTKWCCSLVRLSSFNAVRFPHTEPRGEELEWAWAALPLRGSRAPGVGFMGQAGQGQGLESELLLLYWLVRPGTRASSLSLAASPVNQE